MPTQRPSGDLVTGLVFRRETGEIACLETPPQTRDHGTSAQKGPVAARSTSFRVLPYYQRPVKLKACLFPSDPYYIVQISQEEREKRMFVQRFTRRVWARTWCAMLRYNIFACARETRESVQRPRTSKTGPYPPLDPHNADEKVDHPPPRRPDHNFIGTFETPVVVGTGPPN